MTLRFYDSATREVRDFIPLVEGKAGVYLCGLTVQSEPHVGHVRSGVNFDVLRRWLAASGYDVTFIRNITDIDDKILTKAEEQGRPWYNLAYLMARELDKAYDALNVLPPTYQPAATAHIPEMVELIDTLITRGHAYAADDGSGDVYFDVESWPAYGELSGQRMQEMSAGEDADPRGKRDPRDFALWKSFKEATEPKTAAWPSPWGPGRPGWHIECSAMALKYLGGAFDIHGGGIDLRFPHHENEQAQSRAAGFGFVSYWMHNAWITTAGEKMSKSLGNSLVVPSVLERVRAIELRFYMVSAHYRSHVEFSFEALSEAAAGFTRIERTVQKAHDALDDEGRAALEGLSTIADGRSDFPEDFVAAMDDDLATSRAVAAVQTQVREVNNLLASQALDQPSLDQPSLAQRYAWLRNMLGVLGVDPLDPHWAQVGSGSEEKLAAAVSVLMTGLLEQRAAARASKDFATADAIRDHIKAAGIELEDTAQGPVWSI